MVITTSDGAVYLIADTILYENKKDGNVSIVGSGKVKAKESGGTDGKMTFNMNIDESSIYPDKSAPLYIVNGKEIKSFEIRDIDPNLIKSMDVLKNESATELYGERGRNGVIQITLKTKGEQSDTTGTSIIKMKAPQGFIAELKAGIKTTPLFYVGGKSITEEEMKNLKPNDIESINVLKGENAIEKYGAEAKDGVVEITMKKPAT